MHTTCRKQNVCEYEEFNIERKKKKKRNKVDSFHLLYSTLFAKRSNAFVDAFLHGVQAGRLRMFAKYASNINASTIVSFFLHNCTRPAVCVVARGHCGW